MKRIIGIFICLTVLYLVGCGKEEKGNTENNYPKTARDIAIFEKITMDMKIPQVFKLVGQPDGDTGSGLHVYHYNLSDGSVVTIGTADNKKIFYIYHGFKGEKTPRFMLPDEVKWRNSWAKGEKARVPVEYSGYEQLIWPSDLSDEITETWAKENKITGLSEKEIKKQFGEPLKVLINESAGPCLFIYQTFCIIFYDGKCAGCAPNNANCEKYFMQPDL